MTASEERTDGVRLQKALAAAGGVASRRVSEQLIVEGRVEVNGTVVTELGSRIDPEHDLVAVDGTAIQLDAEKRYYMLNKPTGVVSSMRDEQGGPTSRASRTTSRSACSTSGGSTPRRAGCCCSRTTANWRTCSPTRRSASRRPTSPRSRAGSRPRPSSG